MIHVLGVISSIGAFVFGLSVRRACNGESLWQVLLVVGLGVWMAALLIMRDVAIRDLTQRVKELEER